MAPSQLPRGRLPVGVIETRVSLGCQGADLLPVGDQLLPLHLDLRGAQGVGLLQAVGLGTQRLDLGAQDVSTVLPT